MLSERATRAGLKELQIFDDFWIDTNLPKHKKENENEKYGIAVDASGVWGIPTNNPMGESESRKPRFKKWLIKILEGKKKEEKKPVKKISVLEFFTNLTKSYEELTPIAEIAQHYEKAVAHAQVMGQTALIEKLKDLADVVRGEAHLITMGLKKYVTEKQVIDFYEKVGEDKCLKLTWIRNFNRIIPDDICKMKKEIDDRKIFDNYVILHYDPTNTGEKLTKKEIEKKKDPILFGVMRNSRKLYFVADWKDDFCDLTLEEMFTTLGDKVLKINNKSVKSYIDKV